MGIYWSFQKLFKERELKKTLYINVMAQHEDLFTGEFSHFECVVFVCFINYLILNCTRLNYLRLIYAQFLTSLLTAIFIFLSTWLLIIIITSASDLQPSTAIANQLPGQLVYTQITTRGPNCFKFTIALIMPSKTNIIKYDSTYSRDR